MSLLKSLQKKITCVSLPWVDSEFDPELVKLINEIVLGEESDQDQFGNPMSHFKLYLLAMEEIGADTKEIRIFLKDYNLQLLPSELKEVIGFHLDIAMNAKVHEVASSFFFGREKLIPDMFQQIVDVLNSSPINGETFKYYLERHIEVDSGEHGPKALKCLQKLTNSETKKNEATQIAVKSLEMRWKLWDFILLEIEKSKLD